MDRTRNLEQALGKWVRGKVPFALAEFLLFGLKQAWAATFGGLILCALIITKYLWPEDAILSRYDALFLFCIALQYAMLHLGLETQDEAKLILIFHVTGTVMEIFKVWSESWIYPETAIFAIAGVPLFSGFMYASVGSFIVRVIRAFHMKFAPFPPIWRTWVLAILIYVNFFSHHYIPDARYVLISATVILFFRTRIWFRIGDTYYWMPFSIAAALASFFLWIAEHVGTRTHTWLYASEQSWSIVNFSKMGSWYLLLYVAFATVRITFRDHLLRDRFDPDKDLREK